MNNVKVLYVYDPLCGWCFGFSGVIKRLAEDYADAFNFETISGGMIVGEREGIHHPQMAEYIINTIPRLEAHTGVKFGELYKQQITSGSLYQSSVKPAIALSVFKEYQPLKTIQFASALQQAQFVEGKSFEDDATYRSLLAPYQMDEEEFIDKLNSLEYKAVAYKEFEFTQQLGVNGFPALIAVHNSKYYNISSGYQSYENLKPVFDQLKTFD